METFEIIDYNEVSYGYVKADNERQALCKYLMEHEELNDVMLWQSISGKWKLAEFYGEDEYFYASLV